MPTLHHEEEFRVAPAELFALFLRPASALRLLAGSGLELVEAPEILTPGAHVILRSRRYGLPQKLIHRVAQIEEPSLLVVVQERGPLQSYRQEQRLQAVPTGTLLSEVIHFEPPGGILGRLLTESLLLAEFADLVRRRGEVLRQWYG